MARVPGKAHSLGGFYLPLKNVGLRAKRTHLQNNKATKFGDINKSQRNVEKNQKKENNTKGMVRVNFQVG
jgi:hypothetical protein